MPKDQRLYAKFTLDFPENQKIKPLSDAAFRCLVEATIWSREQKTDGLLATRLALAKWGPEVLEELSTNDPDKPSLVVVEKGWLIRDYADHQDTRDEIEARSARNKLNGQKGGQAKANRPASESLSENVAESVSVSHDSTTAKAVVGQRKRGHRIPDNWRPSDDTKAWARQRYPHLDLNGEWEAFVNHWTAESGRAASKLDWDAAFRKWLHNARAPALKAVVNGSGHDAKVSDYLAYATPKTPELEQ